MYLLKLRRDYEAKKGQKYQLSQMQNKKYKIRILGERNLKMSGGQDNQ